MTLPGMSQHDVFISYSRRDAAAAGEVRTALENQGIHCWFDQRDLTGGAYPSQLEEKIRRCRSIPSSIRDTGIRRPRGPGGRGRRVGERHRSGDSSRFAKIGRDEPRDAKRPAGCGNDVERPRDGDRRRGLGR
jgi:hypothetical protein